MSGLSLACAGEISPAQARAAGTAGGTAKVSWGHGVFRFVYVVIIARLGAVLGFLVGHDHAGGAFLVAGLLDGIAVLERGGRIAFGPWALGSAAKLAVFALAVLEDGVLTMLAPRADTSAHSEGRARLATAFFSEFNQLHALHDGLIESIGAHLPVVVVNGLKHTIKWAGL